MLIVLAIVFFVFQGIGWKIFNEKFPNKLNDVLVFNAFVCFFASIILGVFCINNHNVNISTVILGISFGVLYALCVSFYSKALSCGPLSYTSLAQSGAMIITVIWGVLFYKETVSTAKFFGIILLIIAFMMVILKKGEGNASIKWMLYALAVLLTNGFLGVIQKQQQTINDISMQGMFLFIGFVAATATRILTRIVSNIKNDEKRIKQTVTRNFVLVALLTAASASLANKIMLILVSTQDMTTIFPVINGAILLFSTIIGATVYKEKLSIVQAGGIACGLLAIVMISL